VLVEPDGSVRIAWQADGYEAIHVAARFRSREELTSYVQRVADIALLNRTLSELRSVLRQEFPGAFDLTTRQPQDRPWRVVISFHPPQGRPNPDL